MKAFALTGIRRMALRDIPDPIITKPNQALLKIAAVGICGSDVHYYRTGRVGSQIVRYPFIVGHECSAVVCAIGKKVKKVKPGMRVAVEPAMPCHACDQCHMGRENTCRNLGFLGCPGQAEGSLCEYLVMPEECCLPIPKSMTFEEAALVEPLSIGLYAFQLAKLKKGSRIAVLGSGPIGLSVLAAAHTEGAKAVYMTDIRDYRCAIAKKAGALWSGNPHKAGIVPAILRKDPLGLDAVFECAGEQESFDQAVDLLRPGGTVVMVGIPEFDRLSFTIDKARRKEIAILNVRRQNHCTEKALKYIAQGKIKPGYMVTHRFAFKDAQKGFDFVDGYKDGVVKAMILF
ncbi:MAG: hypothetical protein A2487_15395 [Candidatus Raymondbacteria bacterium RifOxyC12_full_50_8]|nr:MAG: hypothetical protein A2350_06905 [Candidatus Raymondbacteria bacterium RifOxyB12_full_50_8]OGJ93198.1 MAG: hypothetical protein A2248_17660 [Candidatus Raymondbacteria bacterium RIFOXYA2_FULL_49_16]OGJ94649.1 MAG: hypothetical protein A2487_15395 [Candidatus Raymondbacteria bacterium RifOxyC12_full_50_8]OGP44920.1 MAG: hypothetical protein A2324_19585 [Candidatus Raymondbacteria bacterium RIFOXYB2_FULL_49_35]